MIWKLMAYVFAFGAVGGIINALLSDNGFFLPFREKVDAEKKIYILRPGWLGNALVGGVAATVSWGLYGPLNSATIIGTAPAGTPSLPEYGLTLGAVMGALLVGIGGARWLSSQVDKTLYKATAAKLAESTKAPDAARQIMLASPSNALKIAQQLEP